MPDEALITQIENLLAEIVELGGQNERTAIVPNLTVQDADPTNLSGFLIVSDNRDGDNILAKKVGSVIYSDNDLVNVMFLKGGEAIAFQQGSESANAGGIWEIVPSTTTDIFYDKGQVGISTSTPDFPLQIGDGAASVALTASGWNSIFVGPNTAAGRLILEGTTEGDIITIDGSAAVDDKAMQYITNGGITRFRTLADDSSVADEILTLDHGAASVGINTNSPNARLDILDTAGAQLRLTHTDGSKFVDFTLDTNHDLTVTPSSTGQIILQPTTDSTDFFQVLDADGGTPVLNVDSTNERVGIATAVPQALLDVSGIGVVARFGDGTSSAQIAFDGSVASRDMIFRSAGSNRWIFRVDGTAESGSDVGSDFRIISRTDAGAFKDTVLFLKRSNARVSIGGDLTPDAKLDVDQTSATGAIPVLKLDQADISEEMIEFATTIGTGNAIEASGLKLLTPTHFIKVTLPGALTRYLPVGTISTDGPILFKSATITTQGLGANPDIFAFGYYEWSVTDANLDEGTTTQTFGTANISYAAHAFAVTGGAGSTDAGVVGLRVNGTSINDQGTRTPGDTETIIADITAAALDDYQETSKKWLGQVTFELFTVSGAPTAFSLDFNYGLSKYDDWGNTDFTLTDIEAVGFAGANDSNFDIKLMHHQSSGWSYSAAAFTPITAANTIVSLVGDHSTDDQLLSSSHAAWKRDNLSTAINGNDSEGFLVFISSSANNAVEYFNIHIGVVF